MHISAYKLAQEIHVPVSRIQDILHDRRKVTADTSLRLAKFLGVYIKYFLDMQNDMDIRNLKISLTAAGGLHFLSVMERLRSPWQGTFLCHTGELKPALMRHKKRQVVKRFSYSFQRGNL